MAQRDKNHASVIGWSLGNESGCGPGLAVGRAFLKGFDRSGRFVQYEGGGACAEGNGASRLTDVICPM